MKIIIYGWVFVFRLDASVKDIYFLTIFLPKSYRYRPNMLMGWISEQNIRLTVDS